MPLASAVMDESAALLNDASKTLYTYAVQLPFCASAWNKLQLELYVYGLIVIQEISAVIEVAADATLIASPSDLIQPIEVQERKDGTTDLFVDVEEVAEIPEMDQVEDIIYWTWREEVIYINSPSTAREAKVRYKKGLNACSSQSSSLNVINSLEYLANKTAALCARSIGENPTRADALEIEASQALDRLLRSEINAKQSLPVRPHGYGN